MQPFARRNELSLPRKTKSAQATALPSRDAAMAYIAEAKGKVGKRELARAFGVQGGDRIWLKQMLKDLEAEGGGDRARGSVRPAGRLPPVVLADVTGRDRDGELVAEPEEWDAAAHGPTPRILLTVPRSPGRAAPGVGDRVLVRIERHDGKPPYAGRVLKTIGRQKTQALG